MRDDRRVLLALAAALALCACLAVLGQRAARLTDGPILRSVWRDELDSSANSRYYSSHGVIYDKVVNVVYIHGAVHLATVPDFTIFPDEQYRGWYELIAGPESVLYGRGEQDVVIYKLDGGSMQRVPVVLTDPQAHLDQVFLSSLGADGRLYGLARTSDQGSTTLRLFIFDPHTFKMQDLGVLWGQMPHLYSDDTVTGDAQGRIYWMTDGGFFSFDPAVRYVVRYENFPISSYSSKAMFLWGTDGLLYGTGYQQRTPRERGTPLVFAFDPQAHILYTHTVASLNSGLIVAVPQGGAYYSANDGVYVYAPRVDTFTRLPNLPPIYVKSLAYAPTDVLYGYGDMEANAEYGCSRFAYDLRMHMFDFAKIAYLSGCAFTPDDLVTGADGKLYGVWHDPDAGLGILDPHDSLTAGELRSEIIAPVALALTRTVLSGPSHTLTCAPDGRVFGLLEGARADNWMFSYDPRLPAQGLRYHTPQVPVEPYAHLPALVALADGRLVGSTQSGGLFVYDSVLNTTRVLSHTLANAYSVTRLARTPDGRVVGATASYQQDAGVFLYDPATHTAVTLPMSLPPSYALLGLAVTADSRVLVGAEGVLTQYDLASGRSRKLANVPFANGCTINSLLASRAGPVYLACGGRLLMYPTATGTITELATLGGGGIWGEIASLTEDSQGRIYGSVESKYSDSSLFVYDPSHARVENLGIAIPTGVGALAACGPGVVYGATGLSGASYTSDQPYFFAFQSGCAQGQIGAWDALTWDGEIPPGTGLAVNILDERGALLWAHAAPQQALDTLDAAQYPRLILQAIFTRTRAVPYSLPTLKAWQVAYHFKCK